MTEILHFTGFIQGVKYKACLTEKLKRVGFKEFDVNKSSTYGIIQANDSEIAYSKWVSPKRTRSYPFARIYNTYNTSKILTVIPVIKDEGKDGDLDKLQYSTISWMNLLNIYIVLGYYEQAEKSQKKVQVNKDKLANQKFNNDFIKAQIQEILDYKQSALHWNISLFEKHFVTIFRQALDAYTNISKLTGVKIHSQVGMEKYLQAVMANLEEFKNISLKGSQTASKREAMTSHKLEHLVDGVKATFSIKNYLGGIYYLTPDEILNNKECYIIQESKNSTKRVLPELSDIQDGLFKLILYSNIHSLQLNDRETKFSTRLKLTGKNIINSIVLPCSSKKLKDFLEENSTIFKNKEKLLIEKLKLETENNRNIEIEIKANN